MSMQAKLGQAEREKLAKLLGLLSSEHSGERDAAGLAAQRFLKQRGISWVEVLIPQPAERRLPEFGTWRATCRRLMERPRDLRAWERTFVADLPNFGRISVKQRYVLTEIAKRVLGDQA